MLCYATRPFYWLLCKVSEAFPNALGVLITAGDEGAAYCFRSPSNTEHAGYVPCFKVIILRHSWQPFPHALHNYRSVEDIQIWLLLLKALSSKHCLWALTAYLIFHADQCCRDHRCRWRIHCRFYLQINPGNHVLWPYYEPMCRLRSLF